ncbi:hypothetical protein GCM10011505_05030 [Tistrella bauzanensis]|uniref:Uncharacterized protein n=1 Tax=Tistrella bauzanensis TaxID=657419 RepID=A0ABQ1I9G6_9PROT|nr:hypothetical protein GCM10011505_05030 [Tistrella bauzanensis]
MAPVAGRLIVPGRCGKGCLPVEGEVWQRQGQHASGQDLPPPGGNGDVWHGGNRIDERGARSRPPEIR